MTITTDLVLAFSTGFLAVVAVIGLLVQFVLLPYLRDNLFKPVQAIDRQVSNTHEENLREDLDRKHEIQLAQMSDLQSQLADLRLIFTAHNAWSTTEVNRIWAALSRKQDKDK